MTTAEMAQYLDKTAVYYAVPNMVFTVTIVDARMSWGKLQLQIKPRDGYGVKWVNAESVGEIS
jgi:hypothetical protein